MRIALVIEIVVGLMLFVSCGKYDGTGESESVLLGDDDTENVEDESSREASIQAFEQTVFPLMRDQCADCHAGTGPGTPSLAHFDPATAHFALVQNQKVYLGNPVDSRIVQRLAVDLHYCWNVCTEDAESVRAAVSAWAQMVDFGGGSMDVEKIRSLDQQLSDGQEIDPGDDRYADNAIVMYEFKEGAGEIAHDTSGVSPAVDLKLEDMHWMSSWGIQNIPGENGVAMATREASRKIYDQIADPELGSQQYSIEAWIVAANISQEGPARIVSYSRGTGQRNFSMGQTQYNYDFRSRSISEDASDNGTPALSTYDDDRDLQATLQHAVMTYDPYGGRAIYVNGEFTDDLDEIEPAPLWNWDPDHQLVVGNETSQNRLWLGKLRYVAIHREALTQEQILQNYRAGVGRRIVVQFDVSQWAGAGTGVEATISELDAHSYLVCEPIFVGAEPNGIRLAKMRVAVNGIAPVAGQAFTELDVGVFEPNQGLSKGCSVVAKDLGADSDKFSLEFEYLGSFQDIAESTNPPVVPDLSINEPVPLVGLRDFDRINNTMAAITGVDPLRAEVSAPFENLKQQLPSGYDLRAFGSAQQVGISKLALAYCDLMVDSPSLRNDFFGTTPGFAFDEPVAVAFASQADKDSVTAPIVDRVLGNGILEQPDPGSAQQLIDQLIDQLNSSCEALICDAERTRTVVKAACSAMLSSAAMTIH